jgi:hypothetical protein
MEHSFSFVLIIVWLHHSYAGHGLLRDISVLFRTDDVSKVGFILASRDCHYIFLYWHVLFFFYFRHCWYMT